MKSQLLNYPFVRHIINKAMKTLIKLILLVIIIAGGYMLYRQAELRKIESISTFEACVEAGYPVMESYPARCLTPDGRTLTQDSAPVPAVGIQDGTYVMSSASSSVTWEGRKKLISGYVDRGSIDVESGSLSVINGVIASGTIAIDMNSIRAQSTGRGSGETGLTTHLKSNDFFNATKYPISTFTVRSASTSADGKIILSGDLTIRDKTNPINIPVTVSGTGGNLTLTGEAVVNRTNFDVRFGSTSFFSDLGDNVIEDEFKLIFTVVAERS